MGHESKEKGGGFENNTSRIKSTCRETQRNKENVNKRYENNIFIEKTQTFVNFNENL